MGELAMKGVKQEKVKRTVQRRYENQDCDLNGAGKQKSSLFLSKMTKTKIKEKEADTSSGVFQWSLDQNRRGLRPAAWNTEKA